MRLKKETTRVYIYLLLLATVPKFATRKSEANSTVLISYDIKPLT